MTPFLAFHLTWECFICLTPPFILITSEGGVKSGTDDSCRKIPSSVLASDIIPEKQTPWNLSKQQESTKEECDRNLPDLERDDMLVRRMGTFSRRATSSIPINCPPLSVAPYLLQQQQEEVVAHEKDLKTLQEGERSENRSRSLWTWFVCGVTLDQSAVLS